MKKTVTINLAGHAFIIDEDAYLKLQDYLKHIESELTHTEGGKEILDDIESRIAEILKENARVNKDVIDVEDVKEIIKTIGNPSEFANDFSNEHQDKRPGIKRIYRDPDNRWLGGVCGGLGAYFNVDPLLFRILFILSTFLIAGTLIYLVMWIVIPEAVTVAQKLEMRGETVNISNISEKIKDEFQKVKRKMNFK